MNLVVFEDDRVEYLYPITLARPAYAIQCGGFRLVDWLAQLPARRFAVVRPHLLEIQRIDFPQFEQTVPPEGEDTLCLNARVVPSLTNYRLIEKLLAPGGSGVVRDDQGVIALKLTAGEYRPANGEVEQWQEFLASEQVDNAPRLDVDQKLSLFQYPHDLIHTNLQIIGENLEYRLQQHPYREAADGVFLAEGAKLGEYVTSNTRQGPILLDTDASVGPFCYLAGPAYVGPRSRLIEHAAIKDAVSIGHTVKIGGEVEASIIEPYTNKQHYGFLGHSYLGSWINLGAGTCNSDLKNTYGSINMDYRFGRVATGRQFVGCIMGDYAKTAINTGIFTGKTIGVCSMLYGFVTTNVPSFVNYARLFGQVTELPPEVMVPTQQRMFLRRQVTQRPCDMQLLRDMYELTRDERQIAGDQLSL